MLYYHTIYLQWNKKNKSNNSNIPKTRQQHKHNGDKLKSQSKNVDSIDDASTFMQFKLILSFKNCQ